MRTKHVRIKHTYVCIIRWHHHSTTAGAELLRVDDVRLRPGAGRRHGGGRGRQGQARAGVVRHNPEGALMGVYGCVCVCVCVCFFLLFLCA